MIADENQNIIQPPINDVVYNQNYLNGLNNNKYSTFMTILKVICIILMAISIFFEIKLEIDAFSDYDEVRDKIEWSEEEEELDDTYDFTEIPYFFITLFSNVISFSLLFPMFFDVFPLIKIIAYIILITIKIIIITRINHCCDVPVSRHISCSDVFHEKTDWIIILSVIFGLIAIIYQIVVKIVKRNPY